MIDKLEDAIAHAREVAEEQRKKAERNIIETTKEGWIRVYDGKEYNACLECAREHEQLAEWFTELQERREADKWNVIRTEADLPKESDFYLVTIADKYLTYVNTLFFMKSAPDMWEHDKRVIAWKPLPKPYESEDK